MEYGFDASSVHFRAALDKALLARERHNDAVRERELGYVGRGLEPCARETDATIAAVMLTQAAAETYVNKLYTCARIHPGFLKWRNAWKNPAQRGGGVGPISRRRARGRQGRPA